MATTVSRFRGWARSAFGRAPARRPAARPAKPEVVRLEDRSVPATFVVTNILDNQGDATGGLSLRQAILAANANPGFDKITFNIPISPSLPTIPGDPNENYFPIVLATTLPPLTDPDGVFIDATTQPRFNKYQPFDAKGNPIAIDDPINQKAYRPIVQLLPDPNPGAFPNEVGAFLIPGPNNVVRGFVVTGFPGSAFNLFSETAKNNILLNNWINTDISGTKSWNQDPVILSARPPGTPPELTNAGNVPNSVNVKHVLNGIAITGGASANIVGGTTDVAGVPLVAPDGSLIGVGGVMTRSSDPNPIPITPEVNRNVISGTPEFRKDYINFIRGTTTGTRERDIPGAGSGPGIRIMDPLTKNNLIQGNFIGTDYTGTAAVPNHNGIEIYNAASSNFIGNPVTPGLGNLIRFNQHDGVRLANFPNPSEIDPPPPPNGPPAPWTEAYERWNFSVGPYGPGGNAPFYDPYNPNYFQGKTPTGADIIDGGTTPTNAAATVRGIEGQVGTAVTIRGLNLNGAVSVTFAGPGNSQVNSKFTVISDTEITAVIPEGSVTGPIRVFTPAGSVVGPQATVLPSPQPAFSFISAFFPSQGIPSNVATDFVTIRGTNFQGATEVLFGGVPSSKFTVDATGTEIQAFVPNGAKTGPITVVNVAGSVSTNRDFVLLVQPPPRVLSLSATSGVPGDTITITGELFSSANLVRFNYAPGQSGFATTDFTVVDDSTIVVKVPAASLASNGTVQVVTSGGFGVSGQFKINTPVAPSITSLGGGATGVVGTLVTITGTNFTSAIGVTFNGVPATDFTIDSATQITARVPFGATTGPVVVSTISNASAGVPYTVQPSPVPTISAVGTNFRNTYITIDGTNLQGVYKILFGSPLDAFGIVAPEYDVISDSQIRVLIPRQASNGSIHVFTPGGRADSFVTISDTFPPSISTQALINPVQARVGEYVTLEGTGLLGTQRVFFTGAGGLQDVQSVDVVVQSDFAVRVLVPDGAKTGPVRLEVPARVPGDPVQFVLSADFELTATAPAKITSVFPASGPVGTLVTVSGVNFAGATQVLAGGFPVPNFTVVNDRQITFRVPVGSQSGPITVVGQGSTVASATPFTVTASPFPVVQYSTPGSVRNAVVSINGTGLAGTTQVVVGGFVAKFTVISDFQVDAVVPLNANTGVIVLTTPGGTAISPTPFQITSAPLPSIVGSASGSLPATEDSDEGPVGSKFFLNGQNLTGVHRVEVGGLNAAFQFETNKTSIQVTVPNLPPGEYDVTVFSTVRDVATVGNFIGSVVPDDIPLSGKAANKGGAGLNVDNSSRVAVNSVGSFFTYGATYTVVPNARPVVEGVSLNDSGGTGEILRGAPITILGSGFTGATFVTINGVNIASDLFTVVNDARIATNVPISQLGGVDAILGSTVSVSGPGGTSQEAVTFDIGATPALTYNLAVNNQWGGNDKVFGFVGFQGSQVTLTATAGSFYGVAQLFMQANDAWTGGGYGAFAAPQFQPPATEEGGWAGPGVTLPFQNFTIVPGTGGRTAIATIPTDFGKYADVPTMPPPPPDAKPAAFITALAVTNEAKSTVASKNSVVTVMQEAPATSGVVSTVVTGDPVYHRTIVIRGTTDPTQTNFNTLISADTLLFDVAFSSGGTGKFAVSRENFRVLPPGSAILNKGTTSNPQSWGIEVVLPAGFNPYAVNFFPTGNITIVSPDAKTTGTATFTVGDQPVPALFQFATTERAPQDNRIVGNTIYQNGALTSTDANGIPVQGTVVTNGQAGIDFVTADIDTLTPIVGNFGTIFFPFAFGYSRTNEGPNNGDLPGNEGRGGVNDGYLNSFGSTQLNNTFNNIPWDIGRPYLGPNLLQNFPLLQVVQSTVDRTTFSTALLGKPFRAYRIDYFYNPLFNDQDPAALATTTAGYGEIYLGSKVITTDFQGNGSVNFTIFVKQPAVVGGPVPAQGLPSLSNFILPNNSPLPIGTGQGVVTSTATDLTVPGAFGPSLTNGPDGTSRFSFFKRPDNATGGISGRVILDANKSGTLDANEVGIQNAKVELYVDRGDGTLSAVPNSVQTTDTSGSFAFTTFTLDGGFGLPNGNHVLKVIAPSGTVTYVNINPASGQLTSTILNGNQVTDQNFFLYTDAGPGPGPGPGTPTLTAAVVVGTDAGRTGTVNVYDPNGNFRYSIEPYGSTYTGGVRVATADVNGDGNVDVVTAPGIGIAGVVKIYDGPTGQLINSFLPYESSFTGGVYVALGDVNGDGKAEIVTGTGFGGGPRVQVFDGASAGGGGIPTTIYNFFPYEESFRGGVLVGTGDINGDGKADFVTGTGVGGGPRVQVFDGQTLTTLANFFAYEESFRGGVFASVADLNGDGKGEIITGSGVGGGPAVKVYDPTLLPALVPNPLAQKAFFAYESTFRGGVRVDASDVNGDGTLDLLTGPGPGRSAQVRAFNYASLAQLFNVTAFDNFFGGVYIGGDR